MATKEEKTKRKGAGGSSEKPAKRSKSASEPNSDKGKARALGDSTSKVTGTFTKDGVSLKDKSKAVVKAPSGKQAYEIGPVLISPTDFHPPKDVAYTLHHKSAFGESSSSLGASLKDRLVFSGESDTMDYVAWNFDMHATVGENEKSRREARGYSGEYMVGVYDPSKSTVTLRAAPMFTLGRSIKSLANSSLDATSNTRNWNEKMLARRGLGETFGNRKTKLKARNEDRMKVDTSNMMEVMNTMQEGIEEATQNIPNEAEMKEEADQARPIPPPNLHALIPQEAYPLEVLIPDAIIRLLNVKFLQNVESITAIGQSLPFDGPNHSNWLKDRMWPLAQVSQMSHNKQEQDDKDSSQLGASSILKSAKGSASSKAQLKILWYVALLWGFVKIVAGRRDKGGDKETLLKKLKLDQVNAGETILDHLFERFTQTERGSSR